MTQEGATGGAVEGAPRVACWQRLHGNSLPEHTAAWCPTATSLQFATLTLRIIQLSASAQAKMSERQPLTVERWRDGK
eukprot:352249-Chlamydomonas_euryale.AAC.10